MWPFNFAGLTPPGLVSARPELTPTQWAHSGRTQIELVTSKVCGERAARADYRDQMGPRVGPESGHVGRAWPACKWWVQGLPETWGRGEGGGVGRE